MVIDMQTTYGHLEVVAALAGRVIDARLREQEAERDLGKGLRQMNDAGVSIDELSAQSGLPVERVQALIVADEKSSATDLAVLAGTG
jgi:hypothetical protein